MIDIIHLKRKSDNVRHGIIRRNKGIYFRDKELTLTLWDGPSPSCVNKYIDEVVLIYRFG